MIRQIGLASAYVTNQDRALDYYVDKLRFEATRDATLDGYRWIEVASPGAESGMVIAYGRSGTDGEKYGGGFAPLMFCDDLRQTCRVYGARGVEFVESSTEYLWASRQCSKTRKATPSS